MHLLRVTLVPRHMTQTYVSPIKYIKYYIKFNFRAEFVKIKSTKGALLSSSTVVLKLTKNSFRFQVDKLIIKWSNRLACLVLVTLEPFIRTILSQVTDQDL